MNWRYQTIVFDLDGTLLDTLTDLRSSTNWLMEKYGWPVHSMDAIKSFVGNGLYKLIQRAAPAGVAKGQLDEAFGQFKDYYLLHCMDATKPYDGIVETLQQIKQMGIATALVTNKAQPATDKLYDLYFKDCIGKAVGQSEGMAIKPAPDEVNYALDLLKADRRQAIYIGDSEVDKQTADNSGLPVALCSWGFRGRPFIDELHPDYILDAPHDLIDCLKQK